MGIKYSHPNYGMAILKDSKMHALFICSRNQWRSPTAELVYRNRPGVHIRSAGTSPRARHTVSINDINWADAIFVMEQKHKDRIKSMFPGPTRNAKIHVLDIPDDYLFGDPELMELIEVSTKHLISPNL